MKRINLLTSNTDVIKRFGFFLLFFTNILNLYGQTNTRESKFNINIGLTYSNMIGKEIVSKSFINGYPPDCYTNASASDLFILGKKFGFGLSKELNKIFSITYDLNYEEKGCKIPTASMWYIKNINGTYEGVSQKIDEKSNIKLKYLVVPVKLETKLKMLSIFSGIYTGVMLDADDYGKITIDNKEIEFNRDKDGRYSRFDVGLNFGTGISVPLLEEHKLTFVFSGNWNISGNDGRGMIPGYENHWYNQSYQFEIRFESPYHNKHNK